MTIAMILSVLAITFCFRFSQNSLKIFMMLSVIVQVMKAKMMAHKNSTW